MRASSFFVFLGTVSNKISILHTIDNSCILYLIQQMKNIEVDFSEMIILSLFHMELLV